MSLRLRLSLVFALVVAAVVAVLGVLLYLTMSRTLATEMDRRLQVRSDEVALALWPGTDLPAASDLEPGKVDLSALDQLGATNVRVHVIDLAGQPIATFPVGAGAPAPIDERGVRVALANHSSFANVPLPNGRPGRALSTPIAVKGQVAGVLQVVQPRAVLDETLGGLRTLLLLMGGVAIAVAAVCGWLVSYRGLQPLTAMSEQASEIASKADFGLRLGMPKRRDEIGRLAGTMDHLLDRVDETLRAHREFVADTSHELRNPLLAIRTNLELLNRVRDGDAREECIREATEQVERMTRLVSDLLLLAQVESRLVVERDHVDLSALAERAVRQAGQRTRGQQLTVDAPRPVAVLGDEGRLDQILGNLLDNAVRHTPSGGTIAVQVKARPPGATVIVQDTGEGIAPAHLPHIFERTFRGASTGGYGLGLAIVKHLTEAHGGHVQAESTLGRGTRITVWLPLAA